jgi:hypothetical protein
LRGGNFWNGSFNNVGTEGRYWSSTVNNANNAHNLYFIATNVNPANNNNKGNGFAIRCVAPLALKQSAANDLAPPSLATFSVITRFGICAILYP